MRKLDFISVKLKEESSGPGKGKATYWPDYMYIGSEDLMTRGGDFYAAWDEENGVWTKSENRLCDMIDEYMDWYAAEQGVPDARVAHLRDDSTGRRAKLKKYFKLCEDSFTELDMELTFLGEEKPRTSYSSKHLPYKLEEGEPESYEELMATLYSPEERQKLEWAIGAIISGDAKEIQKFIVLYGDSGTGKSTFLKIVRRLFEGYTTTFDAKALGMNRNAFVLETFKDNPLVAIQDDGDLSKIKDNTKLNQIVSHEMIMVEEKYKSAYPMTINTFLFMGTNRQVEITEARSGLLRRLIDVQPTGERIEADRYQVLMTRILNFELGKVARRCLDVYLDLGRGAYDRYKPMTMMSGTNQIYNFISDRLDFFIDHSDMVTRNEAWIEYKGWCEETNEYQMKRIQFGNELIPYYEDYKLVMTRVMRGERQKFNRAYMGFKRWMFDSFESQFEDIPEVVPPVMLIMDSSESLLEKEYADYPAQPFIFDEGRGTERLERKWANCKSKLRDIDTTELHGVRYEPNHIVIDFDLKDASGAKDPDRNLAAAALWPDTYAEFSKSGAGVHLHYLYDGDVGKLADQVAPDIDIRTMKGSSCDRRKFTRCRNMPIARLSAGMLPEKGEKRKMVDIDGFKNEEVLRSQIRRALEKKIHPDTSSSVNWIAKLLDEAYASGEFYDVSDLHSPVLAFANKSTNQSARCIKMVSQMHFACKAAEERERDEAYEPPKPERTVVPNEELTFFDIEIFPNVFIICYKQYGKHKVRTMVNPEPEDVRKLYSMNLVGFNNRKYDNHMIWAAGMLGYGPSELYVISKKMIENDPSFNKYPQAYGLSYTDVYDFASAANKMGLKKWEIKLGISHVENQYDWDAPLTDPQIEVVSEYCANDVEATEAVFDHLHEDYMARCILAEMAGDVPNQSTRNLMKKIIFKGDRNPRSSLVYTDLSEMFPGYSFENGVSTYKGHTVGEGGFVYAEPGMYEHVKTFDVASMHPASCIALNYLGKHTQTYADIREARIAIKHEDYDRARGLLDGVLAPFLDDPDLDPKALANALKTALNSLYGYTKMTSALDFVHPRNKDNIIAKRGALFMIDLMEAVQERGFQVVHIKTDSIKVVDPTPEIEEFIFQFGRDYGYDFEVESEYDRFCLVNDAVYIAHDGDGWHATGAQFAEPYVFKTLFSKEEPEFDDYTVTKSVSNGGKMYIDISKNETPEYKFMGSVGRFCPVEEWLLGGGRLLVLRGDKYNAVGGTKGYFWKDAAMVRANGEENAIDASYFKELADKAVSTIEKFGDFNKFANGKKGE